MLEIFFKHLDFIDVDSLYPDTLSREYAEGGKHKYQFSDPIIQKHWLSFYATYRAGYNSAFKTMQKWFDEMKGK